MGMLMTQGVSPPPVKVLATRATLARVQHPKRSSIIPKSPRTVAQAPTLRPLATTSLVGVAAKEELLRMVHDEEEVIVDMSRKTDEYICAEAVHPAETHQETFFEEGARMAAEQKSLSKVAAAASCTGGGHLSAFGNRAVGTEEPEKEPDRDCSGSSFRMQP